MKRFYVCLLLSVSIILLLANGASAKKTFIV